jgi:hypothetical protein
VTKKTDTLEVEFSFEANAEFVGSGFQSPIPSAEELQVTKDQSPTSKVKAPVAFDFKATVDPAI